MHILLLQSSDLDNNDLYLPLLYENDCFNDVVRNKRNIPILPFYRPRFPKTTHTYLHTLMSNLIFLFVASFVRNSFKTEIVEMLSALNSASPFLQSITKTRIAFRI